MKKYILAASILLTGTAAMAQETYESAEIVTDDLNGTARYIGMGGALEALGGDISTIGTNPAGIGMFRRSWIGGSISMNNMPSAQGFDGEGKTVMSFDQMGFVWSEKMSKDSYVNFAFNYSKSRNFNQILPAIGALHGSSLNKNSYANAYNKYPVRAEIDDLLENTILRDPNDKNLYFYDGNDFEMRRNKSGYIGEYDINISGNAKNRVYWGVTLGIKDVHYQGTTEYNEYLIDHPDPNTLRNIGGIALEDYREITGQGYSVKGGVIIRPIEWSAFRIGISISSPTWYTLTSSNHSSIDNFTNDGTGHIYGESSKSWLSESYKYRMDTPWKFGLSAGHTFSNIAALGISYEYADYSTIDNRIITDSYYNSWYDETTYRSESDYQMNRHTEKTLKGVHTLKVGGEYKLTPEVSVRMGYNYVSPMFKSNGARDFSLESDGVYYASTADYINWKDTQRLTLGLGYSTGNFSIDAAYQYTTQKGDYHPFPSTSWIDLVPETGQMGTLTNNTVSAPVTNERHQFSLTLGFRF